MELLARSSWWSSDPFCFPVVPRERPNHRIRVAHRIDKGKDKDKKRTRGRRSARPVRADKVG